MEILANQKKELQWRLWVNPESDKLRPQLRDGDRLDIFEPKAAAAMRLRLLGIRWDLGTW